jgi:hypothetical protein
MKRFITDAKFHNDITVNVKDGAAYFYLQEDIRYYEHRKHLIEEGFIEDDKETINPFYWLWVAHWNEQVQNHLIKKSWIKQEMLDYIEEQINKQIKTKHK